MRISLPVILVALSLTACSERNTATDKVAGDSSDLTMIRNAAPALDAEGAGQEWYPPSAWEGVGTDSLVIPEPEGFVYLGIVEGDDQPGEHTLRRVLLCDGNGKGCRPTVVGQSLACLTDDANQCTMAMRRTPKPVQGGYVRRDFSVQPASKGDTLPSAFPEMLSVGALSEKLGAYLGSRYAGSGRMPAWLQTDSGYATPDGYRALVLSVAGRALAVLVPKVKANTQTEVVGTEVRALHTAQQAEKGMLFFPSQAGSWSIRNGEEVHRYKTYVR